MADNLPTTQVQTVEAWQAEKRQQALQIEALSGQDAAKRGAELVAIMEVTMSKIDRFGWAQMDRHVKDALTNDWCDLLCKYTLQEVRDGVKAVLTDTDGKPRGFNEYQVQAQIMKARKREVQALPKAPPPPERKPVSKEAAADILRQAGANIDANGKVSFDGDVGANDRTTQGGEEGSS